MKQLKDAVMVEFLLPARAYLFIEPFLVHYFDFKRSYINSLIISTINELPPEKQPKNFYQDKLDFLVENDLDIKLLIPQYNTLSHTFIY